MSAKRKKMMPPPPPPPPPSPPPPVASSSGRSAEEGDVCAVCSLQPYENSPYTNEEEPFGQRNGLRNAIGTDLVSLGCGHVFHELCLDHWFAELKRRKRSFKLCCLICDFHIKYPRDRVRLFFTLKKPVATPDQDFGSNPCNRYECTRALANARRVDALRAELANVQAINRVLEQDNTSTKAELDAVKAENIRLRENQNHQLMSRVSEANGGEEESEYNRILRQWREGFSRFTVMDNGRIVFHEVPENIEDL